MTKEEIFISETKIVSLKCGGLTIEGRSSSGLATYLRVRELDLIFDLGRCPINFIGTNHVFISHFHLDHYFGLPIYVSQRSISDIPTGKIFVPHEGHDQLTQIIDDIAMLDSRKIWNYNLIPIKSGDRIEFRKNLVVHVIDVEHGVPAIGFIVCEVRSKLRSEFFGLSGEKLQQIKSEGTEITQTIEMPLIAYLGDTRKIDPNAHPLLADCPTLICECTFLADKDLVRATRTHHMHIYHLIDQLSNFNNDRIILTHFSRRYTENYIRDRIAELIPANERDRITLFLPS